MVVEGIVVCKILHCINATCSGILRSVGSKGPKNFLLHQCLLSVQEGPWCVISECSYQEVGNCIVTRMLLVE